MVSFEAVRWRETFAKENVLTLEPERTAAAPRYNLATALLVVRRMETSATRGAVFAEIKRKNPLYRLVDWLYSKAGANIVQPLVLLAYMLKSVISLGPFDKGDFRAVAIANFDNSRHA